MCVCVCPDSTYLAFLHTTGCIEWKHGYQFLFFVAGFPPFCSEKPQGESQLHDPAASLHALSFRFQFHTHTHPHTHIHATVTDTYRKIMNWRQHLIFSPELPPISPDAESLIKR